MFLLLLLSPAAPWANDGSVGKSFAEKALFHNRMFSLCSWHWNNGMNITGCQPRLKSRAKTKIARAA